MRNLTLRAVLLFTLLAAGTVAAQPLPTAANLSNSFGHSNAPRAALKCHLPYETRVNPPRKRKRKR